MLEHLLRNPTRFLFFTGKGGVGKTSLSSATAIALAQSGRRVLLVSTDPASNLSEVLATSVGKMATSINDVPGLWALDIDPVAAAAAYRERVVGPVRGVLPDAVVSGVEEQLSGACTVEIAAFDEFTGLLADPAATVGFDHVVFDTAPTGHTLRLLSLPSAWTSFLDESTSGVSCLGPLSGLTQQHDRYRIALAALADATLTTLVLVTRPDRPSIVEADRARGDLEALGVKKQHLIVNGMFADGDPGDALANALAARHATALAELPASLAALTRDTVPLLASAPVGLPGLRLLLEGTASVVDATGEDELIPATTSLLEIAERVAGHGSGLVMTMGKGGVGKTTIAAALAVHLARQGIPVTLSTTDPAAHLALTLAGDAQLPATLDVERIDPVAVTAQYTAEVLSESGAGLDEGGLAVLKEDLRSPCTEEIAVFRTFADTVAKAAGRIVVLDTAPTGHTLLLLDAARSYHREVSRQTGAVPTSVANLLERLTDPDYTYVLVVTLPEQTPVHEAAALQADLERAGITPSAWIANQCLVATDTSDPLLAARANSEIRWLNEIRSLHDELAIVAWQPEHPSGANALERLISSSARARSGATSTIASPA